MSAFLTEKEDIILNIQRINSQTTFGYNKQLNRELVEKLDNDRQNYKTYTNNIRTLNNLCNSAEQNLRISVHRGSDNQDKFFDIFERLKNTLAVTVDNTYPELEFSKRESKEYLSEDDHLALNDDYDVYKKSWQYSIGNELDMLASHNIDPELEDRIVEEIIEEEKQEELNEEKIKEEALPLVVPEVIEKFVPTYSSPTGFESIGGMDELKADLIDKIIYPANHPAEAALDLKEYGKRPPRGILFFGPPGCGKTMTAEAVAREGNMPLFKLKISRAGSKYINQTSKNYQEAFDYVEKYAKELATPCIMLIDEVDGITKGRDGSSSGEDLKQMSTLLNLIESARDKNIIVIGTTNKYDIVDEAIRRRFDDQIYVGMPDVQTREQILEKTLSQWLKGVPLAEDTDSLKEIATKTNGFPSSALVILANKASNRARKDGRRLIQKEDFFEEIKNNQNLKIKEENYKNKAAQKPIGFGL